MHGLPSCRVTSKSAVRSFHSQRGEGKLFNADLLVSDGEAFDKQDAEGSEIRIAFFNESVDLFFDFLQQGHVYDICNVKVCVDCAGEEVSFANRRYNPLKNEYELSASRFSSLLRMVSSQRRSKKLPTAASSSNTTSSLPSPRWLPSTRTKPWIF